MDVWNHELYLTAHYHNCQDESLKPKRLSSPKSDMLSNLNADILHIQETHKKDNLPRKPEMHLVTFHPSAVNGSAIYISDKFMLRGYWDLYSDGIEILEAKSNLPTVISMYKPPPVLFSWPDQLQQDENANIIISDFHSLKMLWDYDNNNNNWDGELVEEWVLDKNLVTLNKSKDKPPFLSAH